MMQARLSTHCPTLETLPFTKRNVALPLVIAHIRFSYMETKELFTIPKKYPNISACSSFKELLQEAIEFQVGGEEGRIGKEDGGGNG